MKRASIAYLRLAIVLVAIGAVAALLWEPQIEGRNAHATPFEIYFKDPFLAYAYAASIPFFVALYQAFKVLGRVGADQVFSEANIRRIRIIKFCALIIVGLVGLGGILLAVFTDSDDRAGGVAIGLVIIFSSLSVAAAAAMFEWILRDTLPRIRIDKAPSQR